MSVSAWAADASYRLQPGDLLDISVFGGEDMRREVLVLPDGSISYPLAGHLNVAGMTVAEAEAGLIKRLVDGGYYVDPELMVSVVEARGNQVFVMGRVRNPGPIVAPRRLGVMQALSAAGGLDEFADPRKIIVIRQGEDEQKVFHLDYDAVRTGRDLSTNIRLEPGDLIVVPEAGLFSAFLDN